MKKAVRLFLVAVITLIPLAACQTTQPDRIMTLDEFFAPPGDRVVSTADSIVVRGIRSKFISEGYLKADFKMYNNRGRRNVINYRVQWLDKDGMLASEYDNWNTVAFEGQQELIVTVRSQNNKAVDFRLELQSN